MSRLRDQRGSVLVMMIGIAAALAILAGSLVILTVNVQGNSSRDRQQKKSFNVAEAALDAALFKLGSSWPDASHPVAWTATDQTAFRSQFDESLFPSTSTVSFSNVVFYDNSDTNGDGEIGPGDGEIGPGGPAYDAGPGPTGDGLMYVEVQSRVGKRASRLQAQVERVPWEGVVPRGIAVAADGEIYANNHKQPVGVEVSGTDQDYIVIKSGVPIDSDVYQDNIVPQEVPMPVVDSVMDPDVIRDLIGIAKASGSYYSGSQRPSSQADWEGIVAIQTSGTVDNMPNNMVINGDGVGTNKMPGMLIVIGPNYPAGPASGGLDLNGHAEYWGMVYTDGDWRNTGTSEVHGMLMAKGTVTSRAVEMKGDRDVLYNDNCIQNLNKMIPIKARLVPNTWREITPVAGQ